jgi:stress response protein YsnF
MVKLAHEANETLVIAEERAIVGKRKRITGAVRVSSEVREEERIVQQPLTSEAVEVDRVPVDRLVDAPEPIRQDGDVTVIPIHAEELIVETRLRLVEEIHVRRRQTVTQAEERVVLRSEEAVVDRIPAAEDEPG